MGSHEKTITVISYLTEQFPNVSVLNVDSEQRSSKLLYANSPVYVALNTNIEFT